MTPLPTVSQIREVKHLLVTDLFDVPAIARLTGVPIRDVFKIAAAPVTVAPDGTILDGQRRLWAALQG